MSETRIDPQMLARWVVVAIASAQLSTGWLSSQPLDPPTPPAGTVSDELLAADPGAWRDLDEGSRATILAALERSGGRALVSELVERTDLGWRVHDGDLAAGRTLFNGHSLIVLGDLSIAGSYDDSSLHGPWSHSDTGRLVVLGDLSVEHLVSQGPLHVGGTLYATGLVYASDSGHPFEVRDELRARVLVLQERRVGIPSAEVDLRLRYAFDADPEAEAAGIRESLRLLQPDLFELADLYRGVPEELWVAPHLVQRRLWDGEPLFRDRPAEVDLIDRLRVLLDPATPAARLPDLVLGDPLLALVGARHRPDLPTSLVVDLIERRNWPLIEALQGNTAITGRMRQRLVEVSNEIMSRTRPRRIPPP